MKKSTAILTTALMLTTGAIVSFPAPVLAFDGWHIDNVATIPGKGSGWDYVSVDAEHHRLFIGHRNEGLQIYDTAEKKLIKVMENSEALKPNGATLIPEFDLGLSNNTDGSITPFKLSTLAPGAAIKLGDELDTSYYDPKTQRLVVNMGTGKTGTDLIVLQVPSLKVVGKISLPTRKPEHAESDGKGNFFLAATDLDKVFRLDLEHLKITGAWPTTGCGHPTGLAIDPVNSRVFLGCRGRGELKPSFIVMNGVSGTVVYASEMGAGNDDVIYDPDLKRIFLPDGDNAVMYVFEQTGADSYRPSEALGTPSGLHTMALDRKTKTLYGIYSEGSADFSKKISSKHPPFYGNRFFPNKFSVLTITKN